MLFHKCFDDQEKESQKNVATVEAVLLLDKWATPLTLHQESPWKHQHSDAIPLLLPLGDEQHAQSLCRWLQAEEPLASKAPKIPPLPILRPRGPHLPKLVHNFA